MMKKGRNQSPSSVSVSSSRQPRPSRKKGTPRLRSSAPTKANSFDSSFTATTIRSNASYHLTLPDASETHKSLREEDGSGTELRIRSDSHDGHGMMTKIHPPTRRPSNESWEDELTLNKLQFQSMDLIGRDTEIEKLHHCLQLQVQHLVSRKNPKKQQLLQKERQRQLVLVSGPSGSGKTELILRALKDPIARQQRCIDGGLFVSGKYDRSRQDEPLLGIVGACVEVCEHLLMLRDNNPEKNEQFQIVQRDIVEQSGDYELQILTRMIPPLEDVVGSLGEKGSSFLSKSSSFTSLMKSEQRQHQNDGYNDDNISSSDAKNRFNFLLLRFLRIMGLTFAPLIIFLDDLQWADSSSFEVLRIMMKDDQNPSLMVVCSYRSQSTSPLSSSLNNEEVKINNDGERGNYNALFQTLQNLKGNNDRYSLNITEIEIGPFGVKDVNNYLSELLVVEPSKTVDLAKVVHDKTHGNPFFMVQYIKMLEKQRLLEYNFGLMQWIWDVSKIETGTLSTANVVDLLQEKMILLPTTVSDVLKLAACLGSSFSQKYLYQVWKSLTTTADQSSGNCPLGRENFQEALAVAVTEGMIYKDNSSLNYRWSHDKIMEASFALIPSNEVDDLLCAIGKVLFPFLDDSSTTLNKDNFQGGIFLVANLLNHSNETNLSQPDRVELARLNLRAAKESIKVSAFGTARKYVTKGLHLISTSTGDRTHADNDAWKLHYRLSLELYSIAAEVEGYLGLIEAMERCCNVVLSQKHCPFLDKTRIYHVLLDNQADRGHLGEAMKLCLFVLKQLGCVFPKSSIRISLMNINGIVQLSSSSKERTPEEIASRSIMSDRKRIEVMRFLDKLATYSYMTESDLFFPTILKWINYTTRYGICDSSPIDFAGVAMVLTGKLYNFQAGMIYANYALLLLDRVQSRYIEARTVMAVYGFVLPWTQPSQTVLKPLFQGYEIGMKRGDTESAMLCIAFYCYISFQSGRSLEALDTDCRIYLEQMEEYNKDMAKRHLKIAWQTILNLMDDDNTEDPLVLTGKAMNEREAINIAHATNDKVVLSMIQAYQSQLYTIFGEYERGADYAVLVGDSLTEKIPCSTLNIVDPFYRAISLFSMAQKTGNKKFRRHAKKARSKIQSFVKKGNPNVRHLESLLDAEMAVLRGDKFVAMKQYEVAIVMATRGGFIQDAAIGNERFGNYLLNDLHDNELALFRLNKAVRLWREWGAEAKARQMEERHKYLLAPPKLVAFISK